MMAPCSGFSARHSRWPVPVGDLPPRGSADVEEEGALRVGHGLGKLLERRQVVQDVGAAPVGPHHQVVVLLLDLDVAHRDRGDVVADALPGSPPIPGAVHPPLHPHVEKVRIPWILPDHVDVVVFGEAPGDVAPGGAVVPGDEDVGGEVVVPVVVHRHVRRAGVVPRRVDLPDPRVGPEASDVPHHVGPARAAVPGDLDVPIVGPGPDDPGLHRRLGDGQHRGVELGGGVVRVDLTAGRLLLVRVVGGEVRTDLRPRRAEVGALEDHVPAEVHRSRIMGGDVDGRVPVEAVTVVHQGVPC